MRDSIEVFPDDIARDSVEKVDTHRIPAYQQDQLSKPSFDLFLGQVQPSPLKMFAGGNTFLP